MDTNLLSEGMPWEIPRLSGDQVSRLTAGLNYDTYRKNEYLQVTNSDKNYVWLIKEGQVILEMLNANGNIQYVFFLTNGNFFRETPAFLSRVSILGNYRFMRDTTVYKISLTVLFERLSKNSDCLSLFFQSHMSKYNILMTRHKMSLLSSSADQVKRILYWLFLSYSVESQSEGYKYQLKKNLDDFKITHQLIANMAGISRVSVSNIFLELYCNKVLLNTPDYYYLKDLIYLTDMR